MTLKYQNRRRATKEEVNFQLLQDQEVLNELNKAHEVFSEEMHAKGYSPLTQGSYHSSVGRFLQFIEDKQVIPDKEQ